MLSLGEAGLMKRSECEASEKCEGAGPPARRPNALDMKAMRSGIGAALKEIYSDVVGDEIPDRLVELLKQLDQKNDTGGT